MIDITFLLLIFFLVASTPDNTDAAELPPAKHGVGISQRDSVVITVGNAGTEKAPIFLGDGTDETEVTGSEEEQRKKIAEFIKEEIERDPKKTQVIIKADRYVKYRDIDRAVKAVSQVEDIKIYLAVLESD